MATNFITGNYHMVKQFYNEDTIHYKNKSKTKKDYINVFGDSYPV